MHAHLATRTPARRAALVGALAVALGAALGPSLLAGCASAPPRAERYSPPPMGSSWTYQVTSTGSFGNGTTQLTLRMARGTWEGREVLKFEAPAFSQLQDAQIGLLAVLDASGRVMMSYDPPLTFTWPLEVGRTWRHQHVLTANPGERKVPMISEWVVEAHEDVTVPAGTFKAWRVAMTDSFGFRQVIWSVPETMGVFARRTSERPAGHPQGAGTQLFELTRRPSMP
ncbi:hypothetical protein [Ideonella sp. A 288]|uniref:hypothetical protein n=1 Tax=Ideonella sp. A 288 TaxID=1962181 RepID=UPI000B4A67EC|nr:hypothetical protein [Ideonella sp. A 288]